MSMPLLNSEQNVQPKNLDEFYETFGITEQDAMYLAPEKRVRIW